MEMISAGRVRSNCAHCGKSVEAYLSHYKRRGFITCSLSCARSHFPSKKQDRATLSCEVCNKPFSVIRSRSIASGKKPKARFCSDKCKNIKQKGTGHPKYIDGRAEARAQCRKVISSRIMEEGCCQRCGSTAYLHGHHIKSFAAYPDLRNDPSNIEVLCRECHADEHPDQARKLFKGVPRSGENVKCPACGGLFYVKRSHLHLRTTCSRQCAVGLRATRAG